MIKKTIKLSNGIDIPILGLGMWQVPKDIATRVALDGIDVGYIHIDTATVYGNEEEVGKAIKNSNIKRENIYITTKIPAETKDYEGAKKAINESLRKLGVDYVDLMLIHCPAPWSEFSKGVKGYYKENLEVYRAMEEAYNEGKIKSLGVSNFDVDDIENILNNCKVKPVINQIIWHIGNRNEKVKEYCHQNGILIEAYSPLKTGRILDQNIIIEMAKKYNVTAAQLCIKFTLMDVDISLPKTTHRERMVENSSLDFDISNEDFEILKNI